MQDLILVGSGGCMRELLFQIEELNKETPTWNVLGFVDEYYNEQDKNMKRVEKKCPFLGGDEILLQTDKSTNVAICVGEPALRKKIKMKLQQNSNLVFPNLILSKVSIAEDTVMGKGCIISQGCTLSTGVHLGDFVFLNMEACVCHEGVIGDFSTLSPRASMAGNVRVGAEAELGMASTVIQGVTIGERAVIGAGAVVVKDVKAGSTVVGVPARVMERCN